MKHQPKEWRDLDPEIAERIRQHYLKVERSEEQKRKDLVWAFDEIHELKCWKRNTKTWLKVLGLVVTMQFGLIAWLADHLYDCINAAQKGLALVR